MSVLLPVDPAYALDYLAILKVKSDYSLPVNDELQHLTSFLSIQMENFKSVIGSPEFHELVYRNRKTFDAIELAHKNKISARRVQKINYDRYRAKKALQERFWPKQALAEQKTKL